MLDDLRVYLMQDIHRLEVYDAKSGNKLHSEKRLNQNIIDEKYQGKLINFFKSLKDKGFEKINVQKIIKRGPNYIRNGGPVALMLKSNTENRGGDSISCARVDSQEERMSQSKTIGSASSFNQNSNIGMNGNDVGMHAKAFMYDDIKSEKLKLENKIERLQEQLENKKDEIQALKLNQVGNKTNFMESITEILKSNPEILTGFMSKGGKMLNQAQDAGLQGASSIQQQLFKIIKEFDLSDAIIERMIYLAQIYTNSETKLVNEIEKIIAEHKTIISKQTQNGTN